MKRIFRTLFAVATALSGAGCAELFLPAGNPPDGAIVENGPVAGEYTPRAAENYLITSLSGFLLRESPGTRIGIQADAATRAAATRVLLALGPLCAGSIERDAPLLLRAGAVEAQPLPQFLENRWDFQLFDRASDTILWQERLPVRETAP